MYLFITGSTGTDKTKLSNKLTHHFKENKKIILISCDSVQIYEEL